MHWLIKKIENSSDKTAVVCQGISYRYSDLFSQIMEFSRLLRGGIRPGEVVALRSNYSFNAIAVFLALLDNKNIVLLITNSVEDEIRERLEEGRAGKVVSFENGQLIVTRLDRRGAKNAIIEALVRDNCAGLILFSSGSTGKPKAMVHNLDALVASYADKRPKNLRLLVLLMFDHIGGLNSLFTTFAVGGAIIIPDNRDADHVCGLIAEHRVNILPASPTFLNLLLISGVESRHDLSSLKMVTYGTESMPETLLHKLKAAFPKIKFLQTFGTSETGIARTSSKSSTSTLFKIEGGAVDYKIVDGELWLRSSTQVLGYLNASMESFVEDNWFKTGDLVEVTGDGFLRIIGRSKEIINVGGEKVLPGEVESVLLLMPETVDCMVYGEKNPIMGQMVVADVVLREGSERKEIKRLVRAFCKDKLDNFKIPVKVNVVGRTNVNDRLKKVRRTL